MIVYNGILIDSVADVEIEDIRYPLFSMTPSPGNVPGDSGRTLCAWTAGRGKLRFRLRCSTRTQ